MSWAGQYPGNDRSAGRRRFGRTRKGRRGWTGALEAALAAVRSNDTSPPNTGACCHGTATRKRSAVKHSMICACWHMLSTGELYRDLGGDNFQRRDSERATKRLVTQLEALGHSVTLEGRSCLRVISCQR